MDKILLKIAGIFALIVGIIYCLTIIGIIVGVPTIIGAVKFLNYAEMPDEQLLKHKDTILVWSIVFIFLSTIAGVLALVFYSQMTSLNVIKEEPKEEKTKDEAPVKEQPKKTSKTTKNDK